MTEEPQTPPASTEEEDAPVELTLEERKEALKKSRWNVFMYLGIAALLFGFALFPMSHSLDMDSKSVVHETGYVWGVPLSGKDYTDVPMEITVTVHNIPTDTDSIEVLVVEAETCASYEVTETQDKMRSGEIEHPNAYKEITDVAPGEVYELEFPIDPGMYCVEVFVHSNSANGYDIDVEVTTYPSQFIAGILATLCLSLSAFAFIGAQKHGKIVKTMTEPALEPTMEEKVLAQTSAARIAAGPSGAPPAGPSGPPPAGPAGPPPAAAPEPAPVPLAAPEPAPAPLAAPEPAPAPLAAPEPAPEPVAEPAAEPVAEAAPVGDVYEDQGNGWFFRKLPDGTYDQTVYVVQDGQYVPYQAPDA